MKELVTHTGVEPLSASQRRGCPYARALGPCISLKIFDFEIKGPCFNNLAPVWRAGREVALLLETWRFGFMREIQFKKIEFRSNLDQIKYARASRRFILIHLRMHSRSSFCHNRILISVIILSLQRLLLFVIHYPACFEDRLFCSIEGWDEHSS